MDEELESLEAIFDNLIIERGDKCVTVILPASLPSRPNIDIRVIVRRNKPIEVVLSGLPRGCKLNERVQALAEDIVDAAEEGMPVLFDIIVMIQEKLNEFDEINSPPEEEEDESAGALVKVHELVDYSPSDILICHGEPFSFKKSVFQAHIAQVSSQKEVNGFMHTLLQDSRIARATHNIMAYRYRDSSGSLVADNDEDGEDAAGAKLAELLHLMNAENVIVVVSRYFGGVLLGPCRFRLILNCAREMIESQPWYKGRK